MRNDFLNLSTLETQYLNIINSNEPGKLIASEVIKLQIQQIKNAAHLVQATFVFMGLCLSFNALSLRSNHTIFIDR